VRVDGHDLGAFSPARLDRFRGATIGVVFQQLRLVRALTVTQNLLLALSLAGHRPDRPRIAGLLERLGLSHRADALSWTLSQGEAQRAAVARAVVARPRLLLADEPTSALDDRSAEAVADLLAAEAAAGDAALLVVTHDQRLKDRFATLAELRAPGAPS
jgi:putative ABC transport system ATP-binding protein